MTTTYPNKFLPGNELQIGDVVKLGPGPFADAIVRNVTADEVTFYRPYGTDGGMPTVTSGGVILYTGLEEFSRALPTDQTYFVYQRKGETQ